MATIYLTPDNVRSDVWWLSWTERTEVIGSVVRYSTGLYKISPQGPHWSPMKSFAGNDYPDLEAATEDVRRYFRGR